MISRTKLFVFVLAAGVLFSGCGEVVEQNEIVLVFKALGKRDVDFAGDNFETEMLTATRAPIELPNIKILRFPKGVQYYEFSAKPSSESRSNEELCVDAEGGKVCYDIVIHMHIDEKFPDLKERLVKFTKAYQLRQYSGQSNALSKFISGRFRQILRQPFVQYAADKKALDLIRDKTGINEYAKKVINERFNQYGLEFTLVSVSSAIRVDRTQQERMNQIVIQDVKRRILKLKNDHILPLTKEIASTRLEGEFEAEKIINEAKAEKIRTIAEAEKQRRKLFTDLIGRDHYVEFETMLNMVSNLEEGMTRLTIIPNESRVLMNCSPASVTATGSAQ